MHFIPKLQNFSTLILKLVFVKDINENVLQWDGISYLFPATFTATIWPFNTLLNPPYWVRTPGNIKS